jgi:NAD(P)-dependent dehydrogenase (short-subunit alcohol dehydrogenase family)
MKLKDRVSIITGGGRGLGRDIALAFAREGAKVVVSGTTESALTATAAEVRATGRDALAMIADVADEQAVAQLVEKTLAEFGQIDILVNNAGVIGPTAVVTDISRAEWGPHPCGQPDWRVSLCASRAKAYGRAAAGKDH